MASYEFPNNSNSNNSNTTVNDVSSMKVKIDDTGNPIKVTWANGTPLTKEEMEKFSNEISDKVDELKEIEEEKRKKREELWKGVKEGFSDVTDKVTDVGQDVSEHVTDEVFGSGYFAQSMQSIFGKTLQTISKSLKSISNFLLKVLGNALKSLWKGITNSFSKTWKILESMKIFSLIGSLLSGIGSLIKGTLNVGGDLLGSLVKYIAGTAAFKALVNGLSWLGGLFSKLSLKNVITSIGEFLMKLVPKSVAGPLAAVITALWPTEAGDKNEDAFFAAQRAGVLPEHVKDVDDYNQYLEETKDVREQRAKDIEKEHENQYNQWLKEYPIVANELFKKRWLIDKDRDNNGYRDYDEERYQTFKTAIENPNNQMAMDNIGLSQKAIEELKNKSSLKNTAGVSST